MSDSENFTKIRWGIKDLGLTILLVLGLIGLSMLHHGGIKSLIAFTDHPTPEFGDFHEHYYPVGKLIFQVKKPLGGYFYSPGFAIFLHLFGQYSMEEGKILWGAFQSFFALMLFFIPGIFLATEYKNKKLYFFYLFSSMTSYAVFHNLKWGQVSILLTFLTLISLFLYIRGHKWFSAASLAIATSIKFYPGFFLLFFLLKKDFSYIGRFVLIALFLSLAVPAYYIGYDNTINFYSETAKEMEYALDWVVSDPNSQYFPHLIMRTLGMEHSGANRGLLSIFGMLFVLYLLKQLMQAGSDTQKTDILRFSAIFTVLPFLINTSWPHYFCFLPFCAVVLIAELIKHKQEFSAKSWTAINIVLFYSLISQNIAMLLVFGNKNPYVYFGFLFQSTFLLYLIYVKLLGILTNSEKSVAR